MKDLKSLEKVREIASIHGYEKTGDMIGVSGRTVRRWCDGSNEPSDLAIEAIKKMLTKRDRAQRT